MLTLSLCYVISSPAAAVKLRATREANNARDGYYSIQKNAQQEELLPYYSLPIYIFMMRAYDGFPPQESLFNLSPGNVLYYSMLIQYNIKYFLNIINIKNIERAASFWPVFGGAVALLWTAPLIRTSNVA